MDFRPKAPTTNFRNFCTFGRGGGPYAHSPPVSRGLKGRARIYATVIRKMSLTTIYTQKPQKSTPQLSSNIANSSHSTRVCFCKGKGKAVPMFIIKQHSVKCKGQWRQNLNLHAFLNGTPDGRAASRPRCLTSKETTDRTSSLRSLSTRTGFAGPSNRTV